MNVFIAGASRTGKSTLSRRILEMNGEGTLIELDAIHTWLDQHFPILGFSLRWKQATMQERFDKTTSLIAFLMQNVSVNASALLNFELVNLEHCLPLCEQYKYKLIVLAHKPMKSNELFDRIRSTETEQDWTNRRSDKNLKGVVNGILLCNNYLIQSYNRLGIRYYETTDNRQEIMDEICKTIKPE
jgi:hypothetical protein